MSLHLTSSNRLERLLDVLIDAIAGTGSVFEPDRVIVPSMAVRRRIELAVAQRHGICANVQFRFLAEWLWDQIGKVVPGIDETSPFAPSRLSWRIHRMLGDAAFTRAHPPLARYLEHADELMRYELAVRLAELFDQYITYRPDWLQAWSADRRIASDSRDTAATHEPWQAALWRRIAEELGAARQHPSALFFQAIESHTIDARAAGLPEAVHVFCLPSMAPLYVRMLRELARWTDLYVYVLNPCEEYWAEIVAPRRLMELRARRRADHHETGNRLLAQWGSPTKAHLGVMQECWEGAVADERSEYSADTADTLLARLQRSMLELTELEPGSLRGIVAHDRSIEVHVCHSLTRELEVLHDQLLSMFAADATLKPSDVLVVTPALQDAAPLIDAVFRNADDSRCIPFEITGRSRTTRNAAARALLDLLLLATSRFHASAVMEVMQQPIVARRFQLDAAALDSIRAWIGASGIRWGLDAQHRAALDLPALARHSFADGIERLLLGYAVPATTCDALGALLPAGNAEGSDALALGSFARILHALEALRQDVRHAKRASEWTAALQRIVDSFMDPADGELDDVRELERTLRILNDEMSAGAGPSLIGLDVMRAALEATLDDPARGGVPGGSVTFASMTSLRNLPYRVVCVVGLDDGVFPALDRPLEFDLIAALPRAGDRQRRAEDRNAFLDLVLAARQRLYLSYTGRNIRDNSELPPSVVVSDLLDVVVPAIAHDATAPAHAQARRRIVIDHPLQPFSMRYFERSTPEHMRSFNGEYCEALKQRFGAPVAVTVPSTVDDFEDADEVVRDPQRRFFAGPLPAPGEEWHTVTLSRLHRFFWNPCRFLLKERLGISLPRAEDELADDEPFTEEWKARCALADRLLPALLQGRDIEAVRALARAGIEYPIGRYGERLIESELVYLTGFAERIRRDVSGEPLDATTHEIAFDIGGTTWRLHGSLSDVRAAGRVRHRYDETRATDYLEAWIDHLFLNATGAPIDRKTIWHSRNGSFTFPPLEDAVLHLSNLVTLYAQGLREPLHFFPRTSWTFIVEGEKLGPAEGKWLTRPSYRYGEDRDAAYQLCLRGIENPLDAEFERCARVVFGPAFAVIADVRLRKS